MKPIAYGLGAALLGFLVVALGASSVQLLYNAWLHPGF